MIINQPTNQPTNQPINIKVDLDTVFKAANFEAKSSDPDDDNPDLALTRGEWIEVLVRVCKNKFGSLFTPEPDEEHPEGKFQVMKRFVIEVIRHSNVSISRW